MNLQFSLNPFSIPIFLTALFFLFLLRISFSKDFERVDRYFTWLLVSCFMYAALYGIELLGTNAETIRLFYYLEFVGGVFIAPFLFLFVLRYSDQTLFKTKYIEWPLFAFSLFFLIMALTNEWHGLFYEDVSAKHNGYFFSVFLEKGVFHWLYAGYNSLLIISANILLVRMLFSVPDLYKGQVLIMLFGTIVPWFAYIMVVFGNYPFGLDPVPFFLAISSLILFWALYKYQLFRTNPIAFKKIFENISDGIVIFDHLGDVVAINLNGKKFFNDLASQIPTNKSDVGSYHKNLATLLDGNEAKTEIFNKEKGECYLAYLREIIGQQREIDRFQYLILRDISDQKATENLIKANEEKMQNVNQDLLRKEKMLTSIAFATKELLSNRDFEIATQKAVTLIGDGAGADRAYLFENRIDNNGNILSSQRFEWSASGVPPEIDNPNLSDLPLGMFGTAAENFLQNNSFHGIVSQMDEDPELQALFQSQEILSVLLIPIYVEDHFWGFVGFDDCTNEKHWSDAETALLISFADSISNAIERKNMEKNLIFSMEQAKEASIAKSEFLANMSHEIRTPLNGVIGFSDLLMKTHLEENQKGYLKSIMHSGSLLLGLINDILDFSKIEAGKLELSQEWINVRDVASETLKIIQPIADEKKLQLKLEVQPEVPNFVQGDLTRIKQIIINLLSNAGKFTHQGKIELEIANSETSHHNDGKAAITFTVKDTGIGISEEKLQTIFEAFAQEDTSTTRKYGGTGLGLTICSKLLELMDSKLELETEVGSGSKFYFTLLLPFAEEVSESTAMVEKNGLFETGEKESPASKGAYKVLLVDDNPVNMLLAKSIVKKLLPSSEIAEAYNGAEAVAQYKREVPDIIFMDIQMPEVSGYEATKQIRVLETGKRTPIIALTAGTVKGEYDRCIEAGMDDYLSKPVLVSDIAGMIEKYLGSQPALDQEGSISSKFDEYKNSDPEFFRELVEVSIANINKLKSSLQTHFSNGDLKAIKQTGHALKGVGLNLDFQELVAVAGDTERMTEISASTELLVKDTIEEADRILGILEKEMGR